MDFRVPSVIFEAKPGMHVGALGVMAARMLARLIRYAIVSDDQCDGSVATGFRWFSTNVRL